MRAHVRSRRRWTALAQVGPRPSAARRRLPAPSRPTHAPPVRARRGCPRRAAPGRLASSGPVRPRHPAHERGASAPRRRTAAAGLPHPVGRLIHDPLPWLTQRPVPRTPPGQDRRRASPRRGARTLPRNGELPRPPQARGLPVGVRPHASRPEQPRSSPWWRWSRGSWTTPVTRDTRRACGPTHASPRRRSRAPPARRTVPSLPRPATTRRRGVQVRLRLSRVPRTARSPPMRWARG